VTKEKFSSSVSECHREEIRLSKPEVLFNCMAAVLLNHSADVEEAVIK
jgi:hypothetical protein